VTALWLVAGLAALLYVSACRQGVPVVDLGPKPPSPLGTITGIVRGPERMSAVVGRTVELINVDTGEKHSTTTASNGGFTIQLPKGKYRLELALRAGETLLKRPDIVDLDHGDIDSHIEFVVAGPRQAHRPSSYRLDNGLGSPIV
jgi:Carboxypeptidase regulatory-like domain